jgi:DNA-binding transcriptional regulator GbsR (MarR family)
MKTTTFNNGRPSLRASLVHSLDDRRDRYETTKDVWEMFQRIIDERKKRECDPTLELLRELTALSPGGRAPNQNDVESYVDERLAEMLGFYESVASWYEQVRKMPNQVLIQFVKMGGKIRNLLERSR